MRNTISQMQAASAERHGFGRLLCDGATVSFENHNGDTQAVWTYRTAKKAEDELSYFRQFVRQNP